MSDQQQAYTMARIAQLLFKRLKGEITPDESQTLNNWLGQQNLVTREFIDKITEPEEIEAALAEMRSIDVDAALTDVMARIKHADKETEKRDQQQIATAARIGDLLFKRLKGPLTTEEEQILDGRQINPEEIDIALVEMQSIDVNAAYLDVQKRIETLTGKPFPQSISLEEEAPVRSFARRFRWLAAACLIGIIAGAGGYLYYINHRPAELPLATAPVTERFHNDVAPGGDKAILKLDDGSTIVLDSAANGVLAQQGSTKITKTDDGRLTYSIHASHATPEAVTYNTISTPRGGQYQIKLPDGSIATLNAASSLRFPTAFAGAERRIEITGQAYFEVAKDAAHPFKVAIMPADAGSHGPAQEIEVLGTEFDVMAYSDEAAQKTTLISGAVKVISGTQEKNLKPGQQARLSNKTGSPSLSVVTDPNIEEETAWKNGLFQFDDASIQSIMRQAARWYDVDVVYADNVDKTFVGKIPRRVSISTLLKILESTGWVHFVVDGKKITVMK